MAWLALPLTLTACSATLPQFDSITKANTGVTDQGGSGVGGTAATLPNTTVSQGIKPTNGEEPSRVAALTKATAGPDHIVGFRAATVILYNAEASNEGERMPASSFALPMRARSASAASPRVEVMTIYGPRWIARSSVIMGTSQ